MKLNILLHLYVGVKPQFESNVTSFQFLQNASPYGVLMTTARLDVLAGINPFPTLFTYGGIHFLRRRTGGRGGFQKIYVFLQGGGGVKEMST